MSTTSQKIVHISPFKGTILKRETHLPTINSQTEKRHREGFNYNGKGHREGLMLL